MNAAARYGSIQNETASRERLMVMLFEAALKHMRVGIIAIEEGRRLEASKPLLKASEIVDYLRRTLDHAQSPGLCSDLAAVYTFVCARLIKATGPNGLVPAREAEKAFLPLADAFSEAVRQRGAA